MAARLALSKAIVTIDGVVRENVSMVVRNNIAFMDGANPGVPNVVAVEDVRRGREWTIRFADGSTWNVERARPTCGSCG